MAENGDEIFVSPGIYKEKVLVEKDVLITGDISHDGEKPVIVIPKKYHFDVSGKAVISNIEICEFEKCKYYCDREDDEYEGKLDHLLYRTVSFGDNQVVRIFGDCSFENCVFRDTRHAAVTVICFRGNCDFRNCTFKRSQQIGLGTKLFEYARDYVRYISRKIIIGSDCVKSKPVAYEFFTKMGFVDELGRGDLLTFDCSNGRS